MIPGILFPKTKYLLRIEQYVCTYLNVLHKKKLLRTKTHNY